MQQIKVGLEPAPQLEANLLRGASASTRKGHARNVERGRLPSAIRKYLEHFQEKCEAVFRQEMRKNKEIERFCDSA